MQDKLPNIIAELASRFEAFQKEEDCVDCKQIVADAIIEVDTTCSVCYKKQTKK